MTNDYLTPTPSTETETLFRKARGARIECERLDLQIQATLKRALVICAAALAAACGARDRLESYVDASPVAEDAGVGSDAGVDADAGTETDAGPAYHVGDPCMCCVWAPGTSYPNGDVYCMHGVVDNPVGYMCRAKANDAAPAWAPTVKLCDLENPWGK